MLSSAAAVAPHNRRPSLPRTNFAGKARRCLKSLPCIEFAHHEPACAPNLDRKKPANVDCSDRNCAHACLLGYCLLGVAFEARVRAMGIRGPISFCAQATVSVALAAPEGHQ